MHETQSYNWLQYVPPSGRPVDIKVEASHSESSHSLLSPPTSPSRLSLIPNCSSIPPSICRRRSTPSLNSPKRARPYPVFPRENRLRIEDSEKMATSPDYGTWSASGSRSGNKSGHPSGRGSSEQPIYALNDAFAAHPFTGRSSDRSEPRPASSSSGLTSSLTGAMGDARVSSHPRHPGSPPSRADHPYNMNMNPGMVWSPTQQSHGQSMSIASHHTAYPGVAGHGNVPYHNPSSPHTSAQYPNFPPTYRNTSPESLSPPSPAFASTSYPDQFGLQVQRGQPVMHARPGSSANHMSPSSHHRTSSTHDKMESEIHHLRKRVRELELINEHLRGLESGFASGSSYGQRVSSTSLAMTGLPSPLATPTPQSASFQASWKARTEARIRLFCSLNRAGNALCAWHDSRRERRAYPPRMAPQGHLNCGCTYEEALFEESLARHSVGSYHPGETVRMDPALRNPLLKLLQERYGYKDGDFERDPRTGEWVEGEGHTYWEQKAQAGAANSRKSRGESDRH